MNLPFWLHFALSYGWIILLAMFVAFVLYRVTQPTRRDPLDDVARYLDGLWRRGKLTGDEYHRFRQILEGDYARLGRVPPPPQVGPLTPTFSENRAVRELPPILSEAADEWTRDRAAGRSVPQSVTRSPSPAREESPAPSDAAELSEVDSDVIDSDVIDADVINADVIYADRVEPTTAPTEPDVPPRHGLPSSQVSSGWVSEDSTSSGQAAAPPSDATGQRQRPFPWEDPPDYQVPAPRTSWAELLQGFMRENNIRWGELLSGVLIVGSAVGLVVSLRHELRETVPYFPAFLFLLFTAAIHGAGAYTLKQWKLPGTSRGVLLIGLLLVPLNFFTASLLMGQPDQDSVTPVFYWSSLAVGAGIFTALTYASSSMLFRPPVHWFVTATIIGCSLWQLPLHHGISDSTAPLLVQMLSLPLSVLFLIGIGGVLRGHRSPSMDDVAKAEATIMGWGLGSFAFVTACAMLAVAQQNLQLTLTSASGSLLPALGIGWILSGGWLHRDAGSRGWQQITGLAISLVGMAFMLASFAAAWPSPIHVLTAAVVTSAAGIGISRHLKLTWLFPVALAQAAVGFIAAWHLILEQAGPFATGQSELSWPLLLSPQTATGLTAYAAMLGSIGYRWSKRSPSESADPQVRQTWMASLISAILSAAVAIVGGALAATGMELGTAAAVLILNGITAILAGGVIERRGLLRFGSGFLLIGTLFAVQSQPQIWPTWELGGQPIPFRVLVGGLFVLFTTLPATVLALLRQTLGVSSGIANRLQLSAVELASAAALVSMGTSVLALPLGEATVGWFAICLAAVSLSLGIVWWQSPSRRVYGLLQLSVVVTSMVTATAVWFEHDSNAEWSAPFHIALQLAVLSGLLFCVNLVHEVRRRTPSETGEISAVCERRIAMLVIGLLFVLSILVGLPGISAEFGAIWRAAEMRAWLVELLHERLFGISWGLALAASVLGYRAGDRRLHGSGILLLVTTGLLLLAALFEPSASTASAIRWFTAPALLVWLGIRLAFKRRNRARRTDTEKERNGDLIAETYSREWLWVGIGLGGLPTLLLMVAGLLFGSLGYRFAGPNDPWFFGRLIPEANYGVPLLVGLAATLIAAWHERERWFARAGFVGLVTLVAVWLLAGLIIPHVPNRIGWIIGYSYLSAMVSAVFGWGWIALERKLTSERSALMKSPWMQALLVATLATALTPPLIALLLLLIPVVPWREFVEPVSQVSGGMAFMLAGSLVSLLLSRSTVGLRLSILILQGLLVAFVGLSATTVAKTLPNAPHITLGVLMFGLLAVAAHWLIWQSLVLSWRSVPTWSEATKQGGLFGAWTAMGLVGTLIAAYQFALVSNSPAPWLLPALALLLIMATWGVWVFASVFAQFGALGILGATSFLGSHPSMAGINLSAGAWFHLSTAAIAIYATLVLVIEQRVHQEERKSDTLRDSLRFPPLTRWLLTRVYGLVVVLDLLFGLFTRGGDTVPLPASRTALQAPWGWFALGSVGLLTVASLWDARQRGRLALCYVWGISIVCLLPVQWYVGEQLFVAVLLTVAAYHGLISRLLRRVPELIRGAQTVRIGDAQRLFEHAVTRWSRVVLTATMLASILAILPVLTFELRSERVLAALVPVLSAFAWGSLVPILESGQRRHVACGAILWFSLTCLLISLADVPPGIWEPVWLRRLLRIVMVAALLTAIYGAVTSRLLWIEAVWREALVRLTKGMASVAAVSLLLLVFIEMGLKQAGLPLPLSAAEASVVAVALLVMIAGLIVAALAPGQLRLQLSDLTREAYIYLAEGVGGLLGIHVLLAMPWLVQPEWRPYWPYGVLALAFAGAGASEVCRRRGLDILARPLLRTGTLLPVVPFLMMWILPTGSDYAIVLVGGGLLYFVLATTQSQPLYAAVGAVCGNIALWTILQRTETFDFFRHPQIWLIPPALSVLLAIQLAPSALSNAQKSLLRYLCVLVIYVSSTSEIFLTGLGDAIWPPMVLIVLSLLGVAFGIALQIRAFLVLGSLFVFISLLSMVMHAQRSLDHVWPWWAFGIGMGIGILTILGFFEKKRPELLAMLERLKQWEG